jgi:hypothetical protein
LDDSYAIASNIVDSIHGYCVVHVSKMRIDGTFASTVGCVMNGYFKTTYADDYFVKVYLCGSEDTDDEDDDDDEDEDPEDDSDQDIEEYSLSMAREWA